MRKLAVVAAVACAFAIGWAAPAGACTGSDGDSAPTGTVVTNPVTGGVYNVDAGTGGVSGGVSGSTGYIDVYVTPDGAQIDGRSSDGALDGRTTLNATSPGVCINGMP